MSRYDIVDIEAGKTYRVRSWEDISENFPKYQESDGLFFCPDDPHAAFLESMKPLCGLPFTVKNIYTNGSPNSELGVYIFLDSYEGTECVGREEYEGSWNISPWMLEECEDGDDLHTPE